MRSNYKRLGDYIQQVKVKNSDNSLSLLLGINIDKYFMPSVANVVGIDLSKYKVVKPNQFACNRMHVGRDYRLPVALSKVDYDFIVSPAYDVFEIVDQALLMPEYLMMWFSRAEFDRNAWFYTDTDVRGKLGWDSFCDMKLPIPPIENQQEIVVEYKIITNRIKLNEQINQKLEQSAQAIYKEWFVDDVKSDTKKSFLSSYIDINPSHTIPKNQNVSYIELSDVQEKYMSIKNIVKRPYTSGSKFQNNDTLIARITPSFENGKTGFVDILNDGEIAFGSTEFIVLRAKEQISPYWVYCMARDENFRKYAIGSMIGSSGRQRVQHNYLKSYMVSDFSTETMNKFHQTNEPIFKLISQKSQENKKLYLLKEILLSKMATIEDNGI